MGQSYPQRPAERWAFPVTCCAVLVIFLVNLVWASWIRFAENAAKKKLSLKLER